MFYLFSILKVCYIIKNNIYIYFWIKDKVMVDEETKARNKLEEAEKKTKKSGGFFSFLNSGNNNVSDACDLYVQVSN